ncbi:putative cadmium resistance transporter [Rosellinia necatrix]|uniref:Putative cadmium resistance transporter n=1 Tax=Rosellinia necatrix TaxID=77044 RepID=A0A1W2TNT9_ROSNE|nr:putative cadmium resistance transporter [Rosellinia necatrix]
MQFGEAVGTAALSFAVTNIDDAFLLVTFFAESASSSNSLTPLKITIGQFIGFTIIIVISLIGFAVSIVLPSEPIGFLGLFPIVLGFWKLLELLLPTPPNESENPAVEGFKSIVKVASITLLNGGDNVGTYISLFSQVDGVEIAIYVVVYYILLGVWCLVAFLIVKQKHLLFIIEKSVGVLIPFLYMGLGVYIIIKSRAYPWSIDRIDKALSQHPGQAILATTTTFLLLTALGIMVWVRVLRRRRSREDSVPAITDEEANPTEDNTSDTEGEVDALHTSIPVPQDIEPEHVPTPNTAPRPADQAPAPC